MCQSLTHIHKSDRVVAHIVLFSIVVACGQVQSNCDDVCHVSLCDIQRCFVYMWKGVYAVHPQQWHTCSNRDKHRDTQTHTFGGKVQGTRQCAWWNGRTTRGSRGIHGTRPEAGGCGTEPWSCWRLYAPRLTFPGAASFNKVTKGSPALCAIRYRPSSNLQKEWSHGESLLNSEMAQNILKHVGSE